ncbi:MAG TPA: beta-ketoacyl-ACP synthase II [Solirubrobacteraceae bacterium]|nr:beta-ketoacyl-ACP synthase II [Solirubrobacteraceae bacterium]
MREVVVTGLGAVTPLGVGAQSLHERWCAGESAFAGGVARCSDFDAADVLSAKEARRADRCTQLAIAAAIEALEQAGWAAEPPCDPRRIGCVLGSGIGGLTTLLDAQEALRCRRQRGVSPLAVPTMMINAPAAALSLRFGLRGPSFAVASACASGAHAIGAAVRLIERGEADAVLAGGAEAALLPLALAAFGALDALSPSGVARPFDRDRDGFVMGEGAGVLVLEAAELAAARGAPVLGAVRGYAASSDAHHLTAPRADGADQAQAISGALAQSGIEPAQILYINAHGTGTPLNDRAETAAIKRALGEHAYAVPVSSLKSAIGHLLGAAGAVEAVATLLAMGAGVAPPTLGLRQPEEGLDLDYVPGAARTLEPAGRRRLALSSSFGFGGHNAVLCLEAL